ncbi:MAG: DUF4331 family protein [Deltaproteobacteria bacterium]|nr:DUF4331 family protein [Deltaproteobacteria bacterium]MCW5803692.1 DUF4331 family protein [Deltaproteobacteria bacterium]
MKNLILAAGLLGLGGLTACGESNNGDDIVCGANTIKMGNECVGEDPTTCGPGTVLMDGQCVTQPRAYRQIEHLARPGINEALLIGDGFHSGYNATAPTFAGVPAADLQAVVAEAKTVLKALYLGACLLNGVVLPAGASPADGVRPAGITCHAIGPAIWVENSLAGVTLTQASQTAAQTYADAVFNLFIPDVMRIDTTVATSNYEVLCGAGAGAGAGLCGGRFLNDDTIDVTYDFLLNGAATCTRFGCGAPNQVNALTSDGVAFDNVTAANNRNNRVAGNAANRQQGHPAVSNAFPYSAPPQ